MKLLISLLLALSAVQECFASPHKHLHTRRRRPENQRRFEDILPISPQEEQGEIWAVLVAGSNGWYNYRHQADTAHAYHLLRAHGVKAENIITFMYDDIAKSKNNPYPGKLFNRPHGIDVYQNISIDYSGDEVNPENFEAVLLGDERRLRRINGKQLNSGKNDKVFIYFTDHGATGLISFPETILTVKKLNEILLKMNQKERYGKLVFYLEACESGSMFENILPNDINIYAITAANGHESSWGTYCDNDMKLPCLGDLFSVAWMEDSDQEDLSAETLDKQFELVKERTVQSHVMHFGDLSIAKEPVADFQGSKKVYSIGYENFETEEPLSWPSRDIELNYLLREREMVNDPFSQKRLTRQIEKIQENRRQVKTIFHQIVRTLLPDQVQQRRMFDEHRPLKYYDCHHQVVHAFDNSCIDLAKNEYALKYIYVLANLCEKFKDADTITYSFLDVCSDPIV